MHHQRIKIFVSLIIAFLISKFVVNFFFYPQSLKINSQFFASIPKKIASIFTTNKSKTTSTITPTVSKSQINFFNFPSRPPIAKISPSPTLTPLPIIITNKPTPTPSKKPTPTVYIDNSNTNFLCPASSSQTYDSIEILSAPMTNPASQPDINLPMRGYQQVNESLNLIDVEGDNDQGRGPQLSTIFGAKRAPHFIRVYQVNHWDWQKNSPGPPITDWPVTLVGLKATPGEKIYVPISGYDIGGGYQVMVLFATQNTITIKYTREDNIVYGYAIHIDDICVDPNLLNLYNSLNNQGRKKLPALRGGQVLGYAKTNEVKVAIRDTGSFMDPRVRKDWWIGY